HDAGAHRECRRRRRDARRARAVPPPSRARPPAPRARATHRRGLARRAPPPPPPHPPASPPALAHGVTAPDGARQLRQHAARMSDDPTLSSSLEERTGLTLTERRELLSSAPGAEIDPLPPVLPPEGIVASRLRDVAANVGAARVDVAGVQGCAGAALAA